MKNLAILLFLFVFSFPAFGQTPKSTPKRITKLTKTPVPKLGTEKEELDKAVALQEAAKRIEGLQNFIKNFPDSAETVRAQGLIVSARAELGELKLQAGDAEAGIALFKLAVTESPTPIPDKLFTEVILGFPINLYARGQRGAAFDVAKMIEEKSAANAGQILDLTKFFINVQYGTEAIRLAKKSVELAPESSAAYQILGIANRLNFQLEDAAAAYAKAVELDGESTVNKLNLAELKRALGKPDEAVALYREILAKNSADINAQTGLTLALFDAGKRTEAEVEMAKTLQTKAENLSLLVGAAYWYAAAGDGAKSVEYAGQAIALEPRLGWAYIAQARGFLAQNKPLEAERVLLLAKQYEDFPTLDYELASARMAAGYFREAAEALKKNFVVNKEGLIETYLGNRILADAKTFTELLSLERKVSLFEPKAADSNENAGKLKALLEFNQKLEAADATETDLARAAEEFAAGDDNMRLHRQLFAASRLLQKRTALPKVLELTQAAISGVDSALSVPNPSAAVLADEIYESRQLAISRNQIIVVPEIPRQTLLAILRGRIEEIAGWTLYNQDNPAQSIVRFKRALSVLPEKSAWWRSSMWRLGAALSADGKEKEALDAYLKSYNQEEPDLAKRSIIEGLYQKLNGSLDGLDAKIGARPETTTTAVSEPSKTEPSNTDNVKPTPQPEIKPYSVPFEKTEPTPAPEVKTEPTPAAEVKTEPSPTLKPEETPAPQTTPETKPETRPETEPTPETKPESAPTPEISPSPTPAETPQAEAVKPEATPTPNLENPSKQPAEETPKTEPVPSPTPEETPKVETSEAEIKPAVETTPQTTPAPEPRPEPTPDETRKTEKAEVIEVKTEPVPAPQTVSELKPETAPQIVPAPEKTESKPEANPENKTENKPENKYVVEITENPTTAAKPTTTPKPLFDPVIINVPKTEPSKTGNTETKPTDEKPPETVPKSEPEKTDEKPATNPKTVETVTEDKLLSGENRPRIIITENTGTKTVTEEITTCKILVNQETLSLLNGGGSLGVEVSFDGGGDLKQITASSSSSSDVEVVLDPGIGDGTKKLFFIIKSVSTKTGAFTITFEAPCGKKEILVKVR